MPLLSVIMPVRNGARHIAAALDSVLSDELDMEVIVQDAASRDATASIVASRCDPRIHFVSEVDSGQSDALNRALSRARGEWVLWLNADDVVDSDGLARIAGVLNRTDADVVYGDFAIADAAGVRLRRYHCPAELSRSRLIRDGMRVFSGSMLFRRRSLIALGGFDVSFHYCMDYELLMRGVGTLQFEHAPWVVGTLRLHRESKSISHPWQFLREYRTIHQRQGELSRWDRLRGWKSQAHLALFTAAAPVRYSRAWSRLRPAKRL